MFPIIYVPLLQLAAASDCKQKLNIGDVCQIIIQYAVGTVCSAEKHVSPTWQSLFPNFI